MRTHPDLPVAVVLRLRELVATFAPGSSILLDSSPEAILIAGFISHIPNLVVTTPSLQLALTLSGETALSVVLLGGELHRKSHSTLLTPAALALTNPFDVGVFGGAGYTAAAGLMEREPAMARSKKLLVNHCQRICALISTPKVDLFGPYSFLPAPMISDLVIFDG